MATDILRAKERERERERERETDRQRETERQTEREREKNPDKWRKKTYIYDKILSLSLEYILQTLAHITLLNKNNVRYYIWLRDINLSQKSTP